jgi:hypothetical protein
MFSVGQKTRDRAQFLIRPIHRCLNRAGFGDGDSTIAEELKPLRRLPLQKVGARLFDLTAAATMQGGLFDRPDDARTQARMCAMDALNARYGRDTVTFAAIGTRRAWRLGSGFISPRYTTNWDELLQV